VETRPLNFDNGRLLLTTINVVPVFSKSTALNSEQPEEHLAALLFQGGPTKGGQQFNGIDGETPQNDNIQNDEDRGVGSPDSVGWRRLC
jgi:hypothetical protein